ncbi:MAG: hypothetical protein V1830_04170 [Candidatus Omnitrophota bacterium]
MKTKQLLVTCLATSFLLSGCGAKIGLGKGGGRITIPFDPPYDRTASNTEKASEPPNQPQWE